MAKKKPDVKEISGRLQVAGNTAADAYMKKYKMDREGDCVNSFTPTAWHALRSAYLMGFAQGSGRGFQEGLLTRKGIEK